MKFISKFLPYFLIIFFMIPIGVSASESYNILYKKNKTTEYPLCPSLKLTAIGQSNNQYDNKTGTNLSTLIDSGFSTNVSNKIETSLDNKSYNEIAPLDNSKKTGLNIGFPNKIESSLNTNFSNKIETGLDTNPHTKIESKIDLKPVSATNLSSKIEPSSNNNIFNIRHVNNIECKKCHGEGYHTFRALYLPCGCKTHLNCLLEHASGEPWDEEDSSITCVKPKFECLNPKCSYKFKNAKKFWTFLWCLLPKNPDNFVRGYVPKCGHSTLFIVAREYLFWLKNRYNYKSDSDHNAVSKLAEKAWKEDTLCAKCIMRNW